MTKRSTLAGIATAFILGSGALFAGALAGANPAAAAPGWHGGAGWHGGGHFRPGFHHRRHGWGGPGWGYRPAFARGYYGDCYKVMRVRFVPGIGRVLRPTTICN